MSWAASLAGVFFAIAFLIFHIHQEDIRPLDLAAFTLCCGTATHYFAKAIIEIRRSS